MHRSLLIYLAALLALCLPLPAAEQGAGEAKLREALRNTMLQMRALQTERDTLQADKDTAEAERKTLSEKLEALTKESTASAAASEKAAAEQQEKLARREQENAQLSASLTKWKAAYQEAAEAANKREAARVKLTSEKIILQRQVADQQRKNQEMFRLGSEILGRYENFGLATALTAREPFVGTTRVRLQNLVQDYAEKIDEQRIRPEPPAKKGVAQP